MANYTLQSHGGAGLYMTADGTPTARRNVYIKARVSASLDQTWRIDSPSNGTRAAARFPAHRCGGRGDLRRSDPGPWGLHFPHRRRGGPRRSGAVAGRPARALPDPEVRQLRRQRLFPHRHAVILPHPSRLDIPGDPRYDRKTIRNFAGGPSRSEVAAWNI